MNLIENIFEHVDPLVGVASFVTLVFLWGLRPKFPWLIYARRNHFYLRLFILLSLIMYVLLGWLGYGTAHGVNALWGTVVALTFLLIVGVPALVFNVYRLDPAWPFRTPKHLFSLAIQYKAFWPDGEACKKELVRFHYMPDLVVDGKRYHVFSYYLPNTRYYDMDPLALDMEGHPVRDPVLMNKLAQCARLAHFVIAKVWAENRESGYNRGKKGLRGAARALKAFDRIRAKVVKQWPEAEKHLDVVRQGMEVMMTFARLRLADWETQARWEKAHGWGWKLHEVRYEDVLALEEQLQAARYLEAHQKTIERAAASARLLKQWQREKRYRLGWRWRRWLNALLQIVQMGLEPLKDAKAYQYAGYIPGMKSIEKARWERRLAWVDLVDEWAREIVGEGLEKRYDMYRWVFSWNFLMGWKKWEITAEAKALEAKKQAWCREHGGLNALAVTIRSRKGGKK